MGGDYFGYILSAYAVSALVLGGLCLWIFVDARASSRSLGALEARLGRRRQGGKDGAA